MSAVTAIERWLKQPGESILYTVDFTELLDSGETLTGTPTVTVTNESTGATVTGMTSAVAVNSQTRIKKTGTVAIGKAVDVRIAGGDDGVTYRVQASCGTTTSNTRIGDVLLDVKDS